VRSATFQGWVTELLEIVIQPVAHFPKQAARLIAPFAVHVADPISGFFGRAAAEVHGDLRFGANQLTEPQKLVSTEVVILRHFPRLVEDTEPLVHGADPITPVISRGEIASEANQGGLEGARHLDHFRIRFHSTRATTDGLEVHLAKFHKLIQEFDPQALVIDPVGTLVQAGALREARAMLTRLIDFLKARQITAVLTNLTSGREAAEATDVEISSIVDTWLLLRDLELGGERNRAMYVLKSRGMAHSNQIPEFLLTNHGIELMDVYIGPEGVLTGSSRLSQEARERAAAVAREQQMDACRWERERKREALEARIAATRKEFEAEDAEAAPLVNEGSSRDRNLVLDREAMALSRQSDATQNSRARSGEIRATCHSCKRLTHFVSLPESGLILFGAAQLHVPS